MTLKGSLTPSEYPDNPKEEPSTLKGKGLGLKSNKDYTPSRSMLKGAALKIPEDRESETKQGITIDGKLVTHVQQRDGGKVYTVSSPYEQLVGHNHHTVVNLTEVSEKEYPETVVTKLDFLESDLTTEGSAWSIHTEIEPDE